MPCDKILPMQFYLRILCGLVFSVSLFGGSITSVSSYQLWAQALPFGLPLTFANPDAPFSIANTPTNGFSFSGDVFLLAGGQPPADPQAWIATTTAAIPPRISCTPASPAARPPAPARSR